MITAHKTKSGWVVEQNGYSPYYRAMVQGAINGRRTLYKWDTLARYGIERGAAPGEDNLCEYASDAAFLVERVSPDRILSNGGYVQ